MKKIDAWWFAAGDRMPHGDNRPIVVGETHSISGPIIPCEHALHCSRDPYDALQYAPGPYLYRARVWGGVIEEADKLGGRHREYIAMRDATDMLRRYARNRALSVARLWDMPAVVRQYLETGDETLREAAWSATAAAARSAMDAAAAAATAAAAAAWSAAAAAAVDAAWSATAAEDAAAVDAARSAKHAENRRVFNKMVAELFAEAQP